MFFTRRLRPLLYGDAPTVLQQAEGARGHHPRAAYAEPFGVHPASFCCWAVASLEYFEETSLRFRPAGGLWMVLSSPP